MKKEETQPRLNPEMRHAIRELEQTIRQRYPEATFRTASSLDSDVGIDIWVTLDVDDPDEVLDLVLDRILELQMEEGVPVHVVPVRSPERAAQARAALA